MATKATRLSNVRRARALRQRPDWVPSIESAQREVQRIRRQRYQRHRQNVAMWIVLIALVLGYIAFYFCFDLVTVQGVGMSPTLDSGYKVLCIKQKVVDQLVGIIPEDMRRVGRNDLVLINYKVEPDGEIHKKERSVLLIKRAAGMPGDEIEVGGGQIIIGREENAGELVSSDLVYPVTVPTGYMFVLGDNRTLSVDSRQRAFGMVAEADVIARPLAVVWPVYAMGLVK